MRVLVTRPLPEANQTATRLAALGHEAVIAPLTTIEPTGAIVPAGPFDLIVATSARALEMADAAALAVETIVVYRAAAVARLPEAARLALESDALDAALCFSRRGAELLIDLSNAAGIADNLMRAPQVCISAEVAAPFIALGARTIIAPTSDAPGLFAALEFV